MDEAQQSSPLRRNRRLMSIARTRLGKQGNSAYLRVMEETGFYSHAKPTEGVIESRSLRGQARTADQIDKSIKYGAVIDELKATAIFELSGAPCIYFAELAQPDPDPATLARLHSTAWNHGLAPVLWV